MLNQLIISQPQQLAEAISFDQAAQQWSDHLDLLVNSKELSKTTATTYRAGFKKFKTWLGTGQAESIGPDTIREWIAYESQTYKKRSINTWLAGVSSFFKWCMDNLLIPYDPTATVKGKSRRGETKNHRKKPLTNAEVRRLLAMPDATTAQGSRDLAILLLFLFTAMRSVEVHRADLADWQSIGNQQVIYYQRKGHTEKDDYKVIVEDDTADAVQNWLSFRGNKPGALFTSLSDRSNGERLSLRAIRFIVKEYMKAAGIDDEMKTTHSLRHTAITNLLVNGGTLKQAQDVAGHASPDTTGIYIHNIDRLTNPGERFIDYSNHSTTE